MRSISIQPSYLTNRDSKSKNTFLQVLILMIFITQVQSVEYRTGLNQFIIYSANHVLMTGNSIGRNLPQEIIFTTEFTSVPQVLVTLLVTEFFHSTNGVVIEAHSITRSRFTADVTALTTSKVYGIQFTYLAISDQNLEINTSTYNYRSAGQMPQFSQFNFINLYTSIPQVALFMNGFLYSPANSVFYTEATISQIYLTHFVINLRNFNCANLKYLRLVYIAGSSSYLKAGMIQSTMTLQNVAVCLASLNPLSKIFQGGIAGFSYDQSVQEFTVFQAYYQNTTNQLMYQIYNNAVRVLNYTLSYFQYIPCIGYCDYCILQTLDQCNECIATTFRINPPLCNCQQSYFQIDNNINCQPCSSKCLACLSTEVCTSCNLASMTINPPNCNTCLNGMYLQNDVCLYCPSWCTPCTSVQCYLCNHQCLTCNLLGCLSCNINYYLDNRQCLHCQQYCQTCTSVQCLSCIPSTYLDSYNMCVICIPPCQSCISATQCLSCIDINNFIDDHQQCIQCDQSCHTCNSNGCLTCQLNYELNSLHQCIKCPSDGCIDCQGMLVVKNQKCQYFNCNDGVWEYGEQCDHENPRSGCCNCQVTSGYICQNTLLQPSYCRSLPNHCSSGLIVNDQAICQKCEDNYLLDNNLCIECAKQCYGCSQGLDKCSSCRFSPVSNENCQLCESQSGVYSNYLNNTCYTICGDGIRAGQEFCDLGNQYFTIGCNDCQIQSGYQCDQNMCNQILYPIPFLKEISEDPQLYNNQKIFQLSYNIPITMNIALVSEITIQSTNFTCIWIRIDTQTYNLIIDLQTESISQFITINMLNNLIGSEQGNYQKAKQISLEISDYLIVSSLTIETVNTTTSSINYIFIILLVLVGLALLFGGLQVFWNLLDLMQAVSYCKYFNTLLPYNLQKFLDIFNIFQPPNLPLNIFQNYANIETSLFINPPQKIFIDGYSCSTIKNLIPLLNIFMISFNFYIAAFLVQNLSKRIKFQQTYTILSNSMFRRIIVQLNNILFVKTNQIIQQKVLSTIIRIVQSNAYDISFTIVLAIFGLNTSISSVLLQIDQIITIITIFGYFTMLQLVSRISGYHRSAFKKDTYASISQDVRIQALTIYYALFVLIKKLVFMIFLVMLYNYPLFQICGVLICSLVHITILTLLDPLKEQSEKIKQLFCEIHLMISQLFIFLLVIDDYYDILTYNERDILGWFIIATIALIILTQLALDSYQQLTLYYRKYDMFQIFILRIKRACSF